MTAATFPFPSAGIRGPAAVSIAGGVPPPAVGLRLFNVLDYGARGDGQTDDRTAVLAAYTAWLASDEGAELHFPRGRYLYEAPIALSIPATKIGSRLISGYGAVLLPSFAAGHGLELNRGAAGVVRNITIQGLRIDGTNHSDVTKALLYLNGGGDAAGYFYRCHLRDLAFESVQGYGLIAEGNCFESQLFGCSVDSLSTAADCILMQNVGAGTVSSMDLYGCVTSGGLRGLYCKTPQGGAKVYGGTFILAQQYGILMENATEALLVGVHAENNWEGGVASPGWTTSQAGIHVAGRAHLVGCYGTANNNKQRYVARVFANTESLICGGLATGGLEYYLRAEGAANCRIAALGLAGGSAGRIHNGLPATGRILAMLEGGGDLLEWINSVNGAAAAGGTLANAPAAGDPTFWLPVVVNGVTRHIPCW